MKKILFLLALALCASMTFAQNLPSYVPTNGLVGYWPFNGNANDESGNGNNGTVNGATLTKDRFGNVNSAYNFENNYISLPQPFFNGSTNVNSLTYSIWFKCSQLPSLSTAYSLSSKEGFWKTIGLEINSNGKVTYLGSQPSPQAYFSVISQNSIILNQWNQIIVTFENSTLKLYLNGNLETTSAIQYSSLNYSYLANGNSTSTNLIGATNPVSPGLTNFTKGIIDDFGIWNRALTQQEIMAMYNGVPYSDTCNAVSGSLTNGLVGYWPFCGNANDDSGHGNNGTVNGATLTTDRFGDSNSAYSFDGISNFINVSNIAIQGNTSRSTSFWFKTNSTTGGIVIATGSGTNQNGGTYNLRILDEGFLSFMGGNFTSCCYDINPVTGNNLKDNNWHNCVVTYDSNTFRFYIDGYLIITTNLVVSTNGQFNYFGKSNDANTINSGFFNGIIDDIGIWNRALTPQEINQLYTQNQCTTNITVTDTLIINVGQLSYSNPITYANNITIYPNPANTQVNISFNNISDLTGGNINIINSLGQQVATTPITLSGTNTTIPLTTWGGAGLYFVQILNSQGQIVDIKKIILQ